MMSHETKVNIENVKSLDIQGLNDLSLAIREKIVQTVSEKGGHFSSPLGATELIVAMHHVFDAKKDAFIFDVSHQAYAHKLLTNRWDNFDTLRSFGGISGFTKPDESSYDYFISGHSSTSISLGLGVAKATKLNKSGKKAICLIGDGAMSSGLVYEALNELGERKYPVIIILNDNEMSISKPIGAISKHLSHLLAGSCYQSVKLWINEKTKNMPDFITYLVKKFDKWLKLITPGIIFEEMGLDYIGPIDGHDIKQVIKSLELANQLNSPVIIHAQTIKGKGYKYAEQCNGNWHGVGSFEIESGKSHSKSSIPNVTSIFSNHLYEMAKKHSDIVGVTAAMPTGTGLSLLIKDMPERFFDIGIAEAHGVCSMASMAKEGMKAFIVIYSTFLQRAYDQIIHDICIMALPVVFIIDRAGIVGADGETHQGAFDISYLRIIPNIILFAPRDNESLRLAMNFSYTLTKPCAIRFPRGNFILDNEFKNNEFELGKAEILDDTSSDIAFLGYGDGVGKAYQVAGMLEDIKVKIIDIRFIKPIDKKMLLSLSKKSTKWFVFSDSAKLGGVSSAILEALAELKITNILVQSFEYDDNFITHGSKNAVEKSLKIDTESIAKQIRDML